MRPRQILFLLLFCFHGPQRRVLALSANSSTKSNGKEWVVVEGQADKEKLISAGITTRGRSRNTKGIDPRSRRKRRTKAFQTFHVWTSGGTAGLPKFDGKRGTFGNKEGGAGNVQSDNHASVLAEISNLTDDTEALQTDNSNDEVAYFDQEYADKIFAMALLGVAFVSISSIAGIFALCWFRELQKRRQKFEEQLKETRNIVVVTCDDSWLPSVDGEKSIQRNTSNDLNDPRNENENENDTNTIGKFHPMATIKMIPQQGEYVASYFKNGVSLSLTIHLQFLECNEHKRGWVISGYGKDDSKGSFEVSEGLVSSSGCSYWVQTFQTGRERQWFVSGTWDWASESFVGNWVTDMGEDGPFTGFERADQLVDVDCENVEIAEVTERRCEEKDMLDKSAMALSGVDM